MKSEAENQRNKIPLPIQTFLWRQTRWRCLSCTKCRNFPHQFFFLYNLIHMYSYYVFNWYWQRNYHWILLLLSVLLPMRITGQSCQTFQKYHWALLTSVNYSTLPKIWTFVFDELDKSTPPSPRAFPIFISEPTLSSYLVVHLSLNL